MEVKRKIGNIVYRGIVILLAFTFLFPQFWPLTMSFKERTDIFTTEPPLFPSVWTLDNFREVFSTSGAVQFFRNSFLVSVMTTVLVVILSTTCAFGLQRMAGKGSERLSNSILMLRMIPVMVLTIPLYLIFRQFGWINSLAALTMCYVALSLPLAIWL